MILIRKINKKLKKLGFDKIKIKSNSSNKIYLDYINSLAMKRIIQLYKNFSLKLTKQDIVFIVKKLKVNSKLAVLIYKKRILERKLLSNALKLFQIKSKHISRILKSIKRIITNIIFRKILNNFFQLWLIQDRKKRKVIISLNRHLRR